MAQYEQNLPQKVEDSRHSPPTDPERRALGTGPIPHLSAEDIGRLEIAAHDLSRKHGGEYGLFIRTTFDTALRVNEVLTLRPMDIDLDNGPLVRVRREKGGHPPHCAISPTVATELLSFAYQKGLANDSRFFTFNDRYAHRIVSRAAVAAGIKKPDGVGWVHLLRHSGAIERLRVTRHPPGVQAQLGHRSPFMTYRYWRTLQAEEALETSQLGVDLAR